MMTWAVKKKTSHLQIIEIVVPPPPPPLPRSKSFGIGRFASVNLAASSLVPSLKGREKWTQRGCSKGGNSGKGKQGPIKAYQCSGSEASQIYPRNLHPFVRALLST